MVLVGEKLDFQERKDNIMDKNKVLRISEAARSVFYIPLLATVGGGFENYTNGEFSTIAGGRGDTITAAGDYGAIGGGTGNIISGTYSAISGGSGNTIS